LTSYAGQKGRVAPASAGASKPKEQRALSPAESERVAVNRDFILENMPDAASFIKELYAEGMIDGWRSVISVNTECGK
jgi:hypothetical protein